MIGTLIPTQASFLKNPKMSFTKNNICKASCTAPPPSYTRKQTTPSLYEVLKVKKNASPVEIKTAYRNLAKVYHPDSLRLNSSDGRDFMEIHEAYSTLSDHDSRAKYDMKMAIGTGENSFRYRTDVGYGSGVYRNRTTRWETDQCW